MRVAPSFALATITPGTGRLVRPNAPISVAPPAPKPAPLIVPSPGVQLIQRLRTQGWAGVLHSVKAWGTELYHALGTLVMGVSFKDFTTEKMVVRPTNSNQAFLPEITQARQLTAANADKERAAVARLAPANASRYATLQAALVASPMAIQALQSMLLDGRLLDASDGPSALARLDALAAQPLAAGITRSALLNDVVRELQNPVSIAQHEKGSCGAATAQILLARKNPAEYVRLVGGLASPAGAITTKGGGTLQRSADWNADNDGGRSVSSRLIQPAFMQMAQLPFFHYDNTKDENFLGPLHIGSGLMQQGEAHLLTQTLGKTYHSHTAMVWNRGAILDQLERTLAKGLGPVPIAVTWGADGHFVQVDSIKDGVVAFTNPWGERDTIALDELKAHLTAVITPAGS